MSVEESGRQGGRATKEKEGKVDLGEPVHRRLHRRLPVCRDHECQQRLGQPDAARRTTHGMVLPSDEDHYFRTHGRLLTHSFAAFHFFVMVLCLLHFGLAVWFVSCGMHGSTWRHGLVLRRLDSSAFRFLDVS